MKEYIERDAVLKYSKAMLNLAEQRVRSGKTESEFWKATHLAQKEERQEFVNLLENAPTAEVVEVRHGRWILEREPDGTPYCFHCSVCDDDFRYIGIMAATDYCPNCGARMDKEDEHETGRR